jgi:hypothetical protein
MVYDLRFVTAKAATRVAFGWSGLNVGNGRILCDSMNLRTAMGMKTLFVSNISFMTLSAERVLLVMGFVPPILLANFFFSPSLKHKSVSFY